MLARSVLAAAMYRSKPALEAIAREVEPTKLGEIKHFTPVFRAALAVEADPARVASYPLRTAGWPSKSNVDLSFSDRNGALTLVELKWDDLPDCVWDVAKLALAISETQATFAFVVAGAKAKTWEADGRGVELFETVEHTMADLRGGAYAKDWATWQAKGDPVAFRLPRTVRTEAVSTVELDLRGEWWLLRCAAVDADPGQEVDVDDLDERWRSRLTPAGEVFYDPTLSENERARRLTDLASEESADGGLTADAAGYLASLEQRRELADRRAGEQGDGVDDDAVERMIADQRPDG